MIVRLCLQPQNMEIMTPNIYVHVVWYFDHILLMTMQKHIMMKI